ncbi:hypothetical protein HO173_005117 [Letharia columbiana]|uniref:Uncharacterized protein n=1 Tax=Letharia columbiana TaxID=112416 RepID=A0A8H6FY16_9LECA|nr:uncharacterized protein HO173_005117 [Letharia columbiana]KAF6236826.1 hypothetical protein HO173_005117 [Letharia columbiana]
MAKAVEDDAPLLATSTPLPQIGEATFDHLALLRHTPPTALNRLEPASQPHSDHNSVLGPTKRKYQRISVVDPAQNLIALRWYGKDAEAVAKAKSAFENMLAGDVSMNGDFGKGEEEESPATLRNIETSRASRFSSTFSKNWKRESLALVRQSEAACELLGARVEELDEQVQEQSRQEDFLLERLYYWRQRFSDLEKSKQYEERRLQNLINDLKDKYMGEQMYRLINENEIFQNTIRNKTREINGMRWVRGFAEDDGPQSAATKETKEPKSNDDPTPYWLTHNHPQDWYGIALEASRPSEDLSSRSRSWYSMPHEEASKQPSPEPQSPESLQFGPCPPDHHGPELHHIPSEGLVV